MNFRRNLEITLLFFSAMIIVYNFILTGGTECFDKFSMTMSIFALMYAIFLRIIQ